MEKCGPDAFGEILYAQRFPGWDGNKQLFSVSTTAGLDSSGRVVHLGLLFILGPHERPTFELPYVSLSKEERPYAKAMTRRMGTHDDEDLWAKSVLELSELPPGRGPATNIALERCVVSFYSLYVAGPRGLTRKAGSRRKRTTAMFFLILVAVVRVWLSVRACEQSSRSVVHAEVMPWHLN
jgi:hypothetical protein